jgi:hypothetical protein
MLTAQVSWGMRMGRGAVFPSAARLAKASMSDGKSDPALPKK